MTTEVGDWWRDLFEQSMISAGKEEKIPIANNSNHQGISAVAMIVDENVLTNTPTMQNQGNYHYWQSY